MPNALGHITPLISDFTYGELSPKLLGRIDSALYRKGAQTVQNAVPMIQGGFRKRQGTIQIGNTRNDKYARLVKMVVNQSLWYLLEFTGYDDNATNNLWIWKNGVTRLGSGFTHTYTKAELPAVQFSFAYPDLFIAHASHAPAALHYAGSDTFTLTNPIVMVGSAPTYYAGTITSGSATISGVTPDPTLNALGTIVGKPISGVGIPPGATVQSRTTNSIVMSTTANANGSVAAVSQDTVLPFQSANNYPGAVTCANQRVYWAASNNALQGVWSSAVGIWDNYGLMYMQFFEMVAYTIQTMRVDGSGRPLDTNSALVTVAAQNTPAYDSVTQYQNLVGDADGFNGDIYSDQNDQIEWMVSAIDIIIGTLAGQVLIEGDANANTFAFRGVSRVGCAPLQGYFMPGGVLFIDRSGKRVMLLNWQGVNIQLSAPDTLSVFSEHLFATNAITQIAFSTSPVMRLWFLRADGSVVCCEYDDRYDIRAWWTVVTDGTVQSIAVGPGTTEDILYMVVLRNSTKYVIEAKATKDWLPASYSGTSGAQAPIFSDCAVQKYNATPFSTMVAADSSTIGGATFTCAGLANLIGKTVACWGDGAYLGTAVVQAASGGSVTLPALGAVSTFRTAIVGLPYTMTVTTMPFELGNSMDATLAREITIPRVAMTYINTLDATIIGVQGGNAEQATLGGVQTINPTLFTGMERSPVPSGFAPGSSLTIQSAKPLPCMVTAIIPEIMGYE